MKRNKAKISGGLMTLKPVVRSGLRLQRGGRGRGRERESGAAEPGDKRAREGEEKEKRWVERFVLGVKNKAWGNIWSIKESKWT